MITFKAGVNPLKVHPATWIGIGIAYNLRRRYTLSPLVITSLNDGAHGSNSRHYPHNNDSLCCQASDLRTKDIPAAQRISWARDCKIVLDPLGFDVVHHDGTDGTAIHLHIEFDPKKAEGAWWDSAQQVKT
jgi:hypothetical protein